MDNVYPFPPRSGAASRRRQADPRQQCLAFDRGTDAPAHDRTLAVKQAPERPVATAAVHAALPRDAIRPTSRALKVYGNPMLAATDTRQRLVLSGRLADVCTLLDGMVDVAERLRRAG